MSRIDEALKRATQLEVADNFRGVAAEPAVDAPMLERYAPEAPARPSTVFPSERVIPLIGPAVLAEPVQPTRTPQSSRDALVGMAEADPAGLDQFRRLGAVLHDAQLQTGLKVLMVSSAVPGEGKTFAIVNLAVTFTESFHRRVLLIDADLRRPTIHSRLGCSNEVGLADVLRSRSTSLPVTKVSPRLSVMTAGQPTSSPLAQLTSDRIRDVITDAAAHFDWVLIDTPPVALLPDAQLVARMTEGVLFVIAAKSTPYALVNRSISELGPERIVGTVLNRVDRKSLTSRDSYGGYY